MVDHLIDGYVMNVKFVRGEMPAEDLIWSVTYTKDPNEQPPVIVEREEETITADPNPNGGLELGPDYTLTPVEPEETPLANTELDGHIDCALHFLMMAAALIILIAYNCDMKKRQARIQELTEQLETEKKNGGNSGPAKK